MPAYILLCGYSIVVLLCQALRRERLAVSSIIAWMWGVSLAIGWAAKFALGRQYW
jgi:hypothetical protein